MTESTLKEKNRRFSLLQKGAMLENQNMNGIGNGAMVEL